MHLNFFFFVIQSILQILEIKGETKKDTAYTFTHSNDVFLFLQQLLQVVELAFSLFHFFIQQFRGSAACLEIRRKLRNLLLKIADFRGSRHYLPTHAFKSIATNQSRKLVASRKKKQKKKAK
jgi:hypothetical protein